MKPESLGACYTFNTPKIRKMKPEGLGASYTANTPKLEK